MTGLIERLRIAWVAARIARERRRRDDRLFAEVDKIRDGISKPSSKR